MKTNSIRNSKFENLEYKDLIVNWINYLGKFNEIIPNSNEIHLPFNRKNYYFNNLLKK